MVKKFTIALSTLLALLTYGCNSTAKATECPSWIKIVPVEQEYLKPALAYNLCPSLFKAMLGLESNWNHRAVNPLTLDFGIAQINYKTAETLNINIKRLQADRAYSIEQGARVAAYHKKLFKPRLGLENWVCAYNQGYRAHPDKKACKNYIYKLTQFNY